MLIARFIERPDQDEQHGFTAPPRARPTSIWDDQMRSMKLMGEEVLPAVREIGERLELHSPFEVDAVTSAPVAAAAA